MDFPETDSLPNPPGPLSPGTIQHRRTLLNLLYWLIVILLLVNPFFRYAFLETWNFPEPDWPIFYPAVEKLAHGESPYPEEVLQGEPGTTVGKAWGNYIYPPLFARLLEPLLPLGFFWSEKVYLWLCLGAYIWLLFPRYREGWLARMEQFAALAFFFGWGPLIQTFRHGQSDFVPLFLFTIAWKTILGTSAVRDRTGKNHRELAAGILMGVASTIKLTPLVVWPVFVCAGRFREAAGFLLGVIGSLVLTGPFLSLQYFTKVLPSLANFAAMKDRPALHIGVIHILDRIGNWIGEGDWIREIAPTVGIVVSLFFYLAILLWVRRHREQISSGNLILLSCFLPPLLGGELNHHYTLILLPVLVSVRRSFHSCVSITRASENRSSLFRETVWILFLIPCFYYWRPVRWFYRFFEELTGLSLNMQVLFGTLSAFLFLFPRFIRARYRCPTRTES